METSFAESEREYILIRTKQRLAADKARDAQFEEFNQIINALESGHCK